jgi:hypothetical protein
MDDALLFLAALVIGAIAWLVIGETWLLHVIEERTSGRGSGPTRGAVA